MKRLANSCVFSIMTVCSPYGEKETHMSDFNVRQIPPDDFRANKQMDALLKNEGIRRDGHLDYSCGIFDDDQTLIATGSCFGNTLRCLAVKHDHRGEALMNDIITHLNEIQLNRGNTHIFLYTKCKSADFFRSLGFYEIVRIPDEVVFMENRRDGFTGYISDLQKQCRKKDGRIASIVMNANPFTLGHLALAEKASSDNDLVHLFIVSEDQSLVPFSIRMRLAQEGCRALKNVCFHASGPYIISNATFPSYFQRDDASAIRGHALLDAAVFLKIAGALHITSRYIGEEPRSLVTGIYNEVLEKDLPDSGIQCITIPRKETANGEIISASTVRSALKKGDFSLLKSFVPASTMAYFQSAEAEPVLERIKNTEDVIHY